MVLLGHSFYFIGLLLFLANLGILLKLRKVLKTQNWATAFLKVTNKRPEKKDMDQTDYQDFMNFNSVMLLNFFWIFFGVITDSWKFFLLLLSTLLVLNLFINLFSRIKFLLKSLNFIKVLILTFSIGLLVINHFHLHLNLYDLTKSKTIELFH